MDSNLLEVYLAICMGATGVILVVAFFSHMRSISAGRMMRMMKRVGLNPEIATRVYPQTIADPKTAAIMKRVRRECRKCHCEGFCERWLAETVAGDNSFCPNARTFRGLAAGQ